MKITSFRVQKLRTYADTGVLPLSALNVFVGPNNAGKSTILRAIHMLQDGNGLTGRDVRIDCEQMEIEAELLGFDRGAPSKRVSMSALMLKDATRADSSLQFKGEGINHSRSPYQAQEPHHLILPFYSHRKTRSFAEETMQSSTASIREDFTGLAAKLTRMMNPGYRGHDQYRKLCAEILGQEVFTAPGERGSVVGTYVGEDKNQLIPVTRMGDGVQHIVGMLIELIGAKNKIFLIEEPEGDLHPSALKALLDLIIQASADNQFFISTHSNIVVRHLCAETDSQLFRVSAERGKSIPTSRVEPVENTPLARITVLQELGYTLSDFELCEGWIIFEESSAERIAREFLIPFFAPKLARLQTVAAGGVTKVEPLFEDFRRLALYSHLQRPYRDRTWVLVDGDEPGAAVVTQLRTAHTSWPADRFAQFSQPQFERYYPVHFEEEVNLVFGIADKRQRMEEKRRLIGRVVAWLQQDSERARTELEKSAADVIRELQRIEASLLAG